MNHTFRSWMFEQFDLSTLRDMTTYGCINGFSGLIYYSETTQLYQEYKDDIWRMLAEDSELFGYNNILDLIATFTGKESVNNCDQFENLLVWYAAERIAHQVIEEADRGLN